MMQMLMLTLLFETPRENPIRRTTATTVLCKDFDDLATLITPHASLNFIHLSLFCDTRRLHFQLPRVMFVTLFPSGARNHTSIFHQLPDAVNTPNTYLRPKLDKHSP
jgi:hypothetical protein